MPFESKAQMRWMFAAEERGEIPKGTARRWLKHTKNVKRLPEKKPETAEKTSFMHKVSESSDQSQIASLLAMLQHHIDDAEIAQAQCDLPLAQESLDDSEFIIDLLAQKLLSKAQQEGFDEIKEHEEEREAAAGVPDDDYEKSAEERARNLAFDLGVKYACVRAGATPDTLPIMVDVVRRVALRLDA